MPALNGDLIHLSFSPENAVLNAYKCPKPTQGGTMSDNRKYYYLKLKENYFDEDAIVLLESM